MDVNDAKHLQNVKRLDEIVARLDAMEVRLNNQLTQSMRDREDFHQEIMNNTLLTVKVKEDTATLVKLSRGALTTAYVVKRLVLWIVPIIVTAIATVWATNYFGK